MPVLSSHRGITHGVLIAMICAAAFGAPAPSAAQQPQSHPLASIRVTGKVEHALTLVDADLQALPRKKVNVSDERGNKVSYEGVPVAEILRRAGVPLAKQLRGPALALYVLVSAADGYRAVFALAEFDPEFTDRVIVLADSRDGRHLMPSEGSFRIIVPGEKRHARWVREVISLDIQEAH